MDLDVLDYVPSPIVVLDREEDGAFVYVWMNQAATAFSGLDLTDVFCRTPEDVFPGRAGKRISAYQAEAGRDGKPKSYSYSLTLPTGDVWIETKLVPIKNSDGTVVRLIANMTDRTQENRLEERQVLADSNLQAMQAEAEHFVAMAENELRSPIRQVRQVADLLREDFINCGDGKLELIDVLEDIGIRASKTIADVLAFSRASLAAETRTTSSVDLAVLSSDIFAVLDPHRQHHLQCDTGLVETDGTALQIILRNLVDNALEHGGSEHLNLRISLEGDKAGLLAFSVRDSGRGLDDPGIAFLDTQDFRYETGFGLLGIRRLVRARGGDIWAEVPPSGPGSLIRFTIAGRVLNADAPDPFVLRAAAGP